MALAAILSLYLVIGAVAAIGSVTISPSRFSPRVEHIFFALLLVPIAAMYLAFVAYFDDYSTLGPEAWAVAVFVALGLLGLRFPALLVLGYALHGGWDLAHEIWARTSAPGPAGCVRSRISRSHTERSARRTTGAWRGTSLPDGRRGGGDGEPRACGGGRWWGWRRRVRQPERAARRGRLRRLHGSGGYACDADG